MTSITYLYINRKLAISQTQQFVKERRQTMQWRDEFKYKADTIIRCEITNKSSWHNRAEPTATQIYQYPNLIKMFSTPSFHKYRSFGSIVQDSMKTCNIVRG